MISRKGSSGRGPTSNGIGWATPRAARSRSSRPSRWRCGRPAQPPRSRRLPAVSSSRRRLSAALPATFSEALRAFGLSVTQGEPSILLLFVGELKILFFRLGQPSFWVVSFEPKPCFVIRVPGVEDLLAYVPPGHLPNHVSIIGAAVGAG